METSRTELVAESRTAQLVFDIKSYSSLPSKQGDGTESLVMEGAGYKWKLEVCPGGAEDTRDRKGCVAVFPTLRRNFSFI